MKNLINYSRKLKSMSLSAEQISLINSVDFEENKKHWTIRTIISYVKKELPLDIFVKNYKDILLLKKDSSSLQGNILRYGLELGTKMFNEKTSKSTMNFDKLVKKFGEAATREIYRRRGACIDTYIEIHGEIEGTRRWNIYLEKRKKAYAKKRKDGHVYPKYNLDYFIKLHGEEKGSKIYNNKINIQGYKSSLEYYIDQYGPIDGPIKCREVKDTKSLPFFIKKYGPDEGPIKYGESCLKHAMLCNNELRYSKPSKQLFDQIKEIILDLEYYGPNELALSVPAGILSQRAVCPDLFYNEKIIEFNGDLFHANPLKFKGSDTPHPFNKKLTALEIQNKDFERYRYFESMGYEVLVIWESEWTAEQQQVIDKCVQFLTKKK